VDVAGLFTRFEQQAKSEVGTLPGERLVESTELNLALQTTWRVLEHLDLGIYVRWDQGSRLAARFDGFDGEGRTRTTGEIGGGFRELWLGPFLRGRWRWAYVEFGYGAFGLRWDDARDDLATNAGDTTSPLQTHGSIAWVGALGAALPLT